MKMFIGTYTEGSGSKGIYTLDFQPERGTAEISSVFSECENPSFLVQKGGILYAANELEDKGRISACKIAPDGTLGLLNTVETSGSGLCHLSLSQDGRYLYGANYASGSVIGYRIEEDGKIGEPCCFIQHKGSSVNPLRQECQHAHSVNPDPSGQFLIAADLGMDKLLVYEMDSVTGALYPHKEQPYVSVEPGEGPRHLVFSQDGSHAYLATEMGSHAVTYAFDHKGGSLTQKQMLPLLPPSFQGENTGADIHLTPDGKFLLVSNRGLDALTAFAVEEGTGMLIPRGIYPVEGRCPRNFGMDRQGAYLAAACQESDYVTIFPMEGGAVGELICKVKVPRPVCIVWRQDPLPLE